MSVEALPPGTRLLHVGPHKTGTTALQGAFHTARESLAAQGLHYAGPDRQPMRAAVSMSGGKPMMGEAAGSSANWDRLVDEVNAADARLVVISSEFFADCDDEAAARVVAGLGPNVHVLVTLRPLWKIVPSQWQQYVQNGMRASYDSWLTSMLKTKPYRQPTPSFWRRHRHDELVARWASAVGAENLTVLVVDESNRAMLTDSLELLLDLLPGTLVQEQADPINRSLTFPEAELVRRFNRDFREAGWPETLYARFLRYGAITQIREAVTRPPREERITTPQWALDRAAELGAGFATSIAALGVNVIGDLPSIGATPDDPSAVRGDAGEPSTIPVETATQALIGGLANSGLVDADPSGPFAFRPVGSTSSRDLIRVVLRRVQAKLLAVVRRQPRPVQHHNGRTRS